MISRSEIIIFFQTCDENLDFRRSLVDFIQFFVKLPFFLFETAILHKTE
jgi:hypothetical protein